MQIMGQAKEGMDITYERCAALADSIAARGDRPTLRGLHAALGGGSMATIQSHLTAWRAAQPPAKAPPVTLDPRLASRLNDIWNENLKLAKADAVREIEAKLVDAEKAIEQARADAAREREAAEQARQGLARAQIRLEGIKLLETQLEQQRAQHEAERAARIEAEKIAAVAVAERNAVMRYETNSSISGMQTTASGQQ